MFDRILKRMRDKVRANSYIMTIHAEEEMSDDGLSIFDVEHSILTGHIEQRQKDRDTGQWKYVVEGQTLNAGKINAVVKLGAGDKPAKLRLKPSRSMNACWAKLRVSGHWFLDAG